MNERHIAKRISVKGSEWLVGLNDENEVIVQAPTGEVGVPSTGARGMDEWYISTTGDEGILLPQPVLHSVRQLNSRLTQMRIKALREEEGVEIDEVEVTAYTADGPAPTLRELGFDTAPKVI